MTDNRNILVYPSTLPGEPAERYAADGGSLEQWLVANVPSYAPGDEQPISATVNGVVIEPSQWAETWITRATHVELRPQPQGGALLIGAIVAGVVAAAAILLLKPTIPSQNTKSARGSSIYEANAQGNKPKLGDVIPEIAGRHKTYPDYLTAPRRFFQSQKVQALDLLLCIGKGEFTIPAEEIKIGATPIGKLGSDVNYQIFQPGEDVTSHQAHLNWYNTPEVGASTGSSGLRLKSGATYTPTLNASLFEFSGSTITIPDGAGTVPGDWAVGMHVNVDLLIEIDVIDGGQDSSGNYLRDILEGDFPVFAPGEAITISGGTAIGGNYLVDSYTAGTPDQLTLDSIGSVPEAFLPVGMYVAAIDYSGVRYRIDEILLYRTVTFSTNATIIPSVDLGGEFVDLDISSGDIIEISGTPNDGQYEAYYATVNDEQQLRIRNLDGSTPSVTDGTYSANVINVTTGDTGDEDTGDPLFIPLSTRRAVRVTRLNPDGSVDTDWPGFATQTTSDASVKLDTTDLEVDWSGPFLACPEGETTDRLEWDIFAPSGLGYINDDGDIESRARNVELQWRPLGTETWNSEIKRVSGATRDQSGWTFTVNLPSSITPEVRVRRIGAESNDVQSLDRLEWYGMRSQLPHVTSYEGVTVLALTLIGSDTIASRTENQVSCVPTRRLPVRENGVWLPAQATRNIAPWVAYIARSIGYGDENIDFDELDRLDATWQARGDYFDYVASDDSTVKESINRALIAGMSEFTIDAGRIRPVRDEPRTTLEHMYTPQNMTGPLKRSVQAPRPDDADGVDVEYFSAETWTKETVPCRLPGDQGFKSEKLRLEGVTSRTKAWQIGMRERRRMKFRRRQYSFETELDALNSRYMSYSGLQGDVPGYGQSGWIKQVIPESESVVKLALSEPLEWIETTPETVNVFGWRRPNGKLAGPFEAFPGDSEYEVRCNLGSELPDPDQRMEPPQFVFGPADRWIFPALIIDINPQGFESVSVEATNYAPEVYLDDNNSPSA